MTHRRAPSLLREFAVAIVPMFFGVYLFAALLETYKDDMAERKDLIVDFYRPMRDVQAACRANEEQLATAYLAQAGTYKLMLDEWDHMAASDPATLSKEYEVLPRSIIESSSQTLSQIRDLKSKLDACVGILNRKYEEVALASATYEQFIDISRKRDDDLRTLYAKRDAMLGEAANKSNPESMLDTLRQSLSAEADTQESKAGMKANVHAVGEQVIDLYRRLSESEQAILKVEQEADAKTIGLFASEVNRRYQRGVLRLLWPW